MIIDIIIDRIRGIFGKKFKLPNPECWVPINSITFPFPGEIGVYRDILVGTMVGNPSCKKCRGSGHLPISDFYK